jgi:hypothetical protein
VLGADCVPYGNSLVQELVSSGTYIVIASVSTANAVEDLEKAGRGFVRALVFDPHEVRLFYPNSFLYLLCKSLTNYVLDYSLPRSRRSFVLLVRHSPSAFLSQVRATHMHLLPPEQAPLRPHRRCLSSSLSSPFCPSPQHPLPPLRPSIFQNLTHRTSRAPNSLPSPSYRVYFHTLSVVEMWRAQPVS